MLYVGRSVRVCVRGGVVRMTDREREKEGDKGREIRERK